MAIINYIGRHLITYDVKKHSHDYWEIIYTTAGTGNIKTDEGLDIDYNAGDLVIIPPHIGHTNRSNSGFHNLHLTLDNWSPTFSGTKLITDNSSKDLFSAIDQAHRYYHTSFTGRANILFALTELIVSYVEMLVAKPAASTITEITENEIINRFTEPDFQVEEAFLKIPYAKEYIRKQYIKDRGISPLQFLINKRISYAVKLLSERRREGLDIRIKEIAEKCGFSDQLYFSRMFKKIMKVSPKDFFPSELDENKIDPAFPILS